MQMLMYNKRVAENKIRDSRLDMADSVKCLQGSTNQFKSSNLGSGFSSKIEKLLKDNSLKEGNDFKSNQKLQNEQLENIKDKLEELEEHHGKKSTLHDLQIKTLKSLQDGSLIRLEELEGEKRLVRLNQGCLAFGKTNQYGGKDDYGYLPCNLFDLEQHFILNKINNLDDYNFLLSSNLENSISPDDDNKNNYPFYTLQ